MLKKGAILPENKKRIEKHSPVYILTEKEFKELAGDWRDKYEESEYKRICAEVAHIDELNELRNQIQELKSQASNMEIKITWQETELEARQKVIDEHVWMIKELKEDLKE